MGIVTGYKATDKNIRCLGYQFVPGQWHEHEGKVELCESGFHFCPDIAGPLVYYSHIPGTKLWRVEAQFVEEVPEEAGVATKYVARRIRLVEQIKIPQSKNFGKGNTELYNIGAFNSGAKNKGGSNSGNSNTGDYNSGDYNKGSYNAGYNNLGSYNTGHHNIGNYNTGFGNVGNNHGGMYCVKPTRISCFDKPTKYTHEEFCEFFCREMYALNSYLDGDEEEIYWDDVKTLPNITLPKLRTLIRKHNKARNKITKIITK